MDDYLLPFTGEQIKKAIAEDIKSPWQNATGDNYTVGSPLALLPNVAVAFICNGAYRNEKNFPTHITKMWDTTLNKATFTEFEDAPQFVANVSMTISPSVAAEGILTVKAYVNEDTPVYLKESTTTYKGTAEQQITSLISFPAIDTTGYDIKNKGIVFTIEATTGCTAHTPDIEIYRT